MDNTNTTAIKDAVQKAMAYFAGPWTQFYATRMQGDSELTYIPWNKIVGILNEAVARGLIVSWDYYIQEIGTTRIATGPKSAVELLDACYVKVELSIVVTGSFVITRQGVGTEAYSQAGYGDPISNATAMALRRAAALFGIGLELYDKESHEAAKPSAAPKPVARALTPKPATTPQSEPAPAEVGPTVEELDAAEADAEAAEPSANATFNLPLPSKTKYPPSEKQWALLSSLMRRGGYTNENIDDLIYVMVEEGKLNPQYIKSWENLSGKDVSKMIEYLQSAV